MCAYYHLSTEEQTAAFDLTSCDVDRGTILGKPGEASIIGYENDDKTHHCIRMPVTSKTHYYTYAHEWMDAHGPKEPSYTNTHTDKYIHRSAD